MKKTALFALGAIVLFTNCEKDDICDPTTPTTPQLVIDFYDKDTQIIKTVTSLQVVGDNGPLQTFDGVSKIKLPLKTTADITQYHFIINSANSSKNEDEVEFDYSRKDVYISRACGFKTFFTLKPDSPKFTDAATPDGPWISDIKVVTPNINDENQRHVKIYF
jgi:hypothetical protein